TSACTSIPRSRCDVYRPSSSLHHSPPLPPLPSSPTRRSSDLHRRRDGPRYGIGSRRRHPGNITEKCRPALNTPGCISRPTASDRSEEHTSELQSRGHLVCRLLLEKKNKYTDVTSRFRCRRRSI